MHLLNVCCGFRQNQAFSVTSMCVAPGELLALFFQHPSFLCCGLVSCRVDVWCFPEYGNSRSEHGDEVFDQVDELLSPLLCKAQ